MSDTLGSLIDKLQIVNLKMWHNQQLLYEIRRMDFDGFKEKYMGNEDGALELWEKLKKCCDLNVQRSDLIDEIDQRFHSILLALASLLGCTEVEKIEDALGPLIQRKHKTY